MSIFKILMVTINKCNLVQGRCMDMVGISSFSQKLRTWNDASTLKKSKPWDRRTGTLPPRRIAPVVDLQVTESPLYWRNDRYKSINMHQSQSSTNRGGFKPNETATYNICMDSIQKYIYMHRYYVCIYIYIYMYYVSLVSTCIRSKSKTSFIKGPGGSRSPWPQIWRHGNSAMPLRAADEVIHTECFSLKWRRLNPEVKSKGYLILHAACITSTPSCSDRRKRRTQCHSVGPRGYSELGGTLQH